MQIHISLSSSEIRNRKCNNFLIRAAYNNLHGRREWMERDGGEFVTRGGYGK